MSSSASVNKNGYTYEPVEEFYAGKSVLITGGLGFLGKVLMEKLIYSCPYMTNLYVLVREKKNVKGQERLQKILDSELFARVKKEKPENLDKIKPIVGDITLHDLGMTEGDKTVILDKVSIVFHLAATIRFDEPLSEAMRINVEGTRNTIKLTKKMKNLQAFIYMSTAFCNTDKMIVEEIVYAPPMEIDDVYKLLNEYGDSSDEVKKILKGRPNTYTFTKSLTEPLVAESCGNIPTVIIRPSAVVAAMHEPVRGWIDKWLGPTLALDMVARGWLRCLYGKNNYAIDIIPVDYVVNATIVAAARCRRSKKPSVYNCCTSTINTLSLERIYSLYSKESIKARYNSLPLSIVFSKSSFTLKLIIFTSQTVPAYILDLLLILRRKPTKYVKILKKFTFYMKMIKFCSSRNWYMISTRLRDLADDLDQNDQRKFPCNPAQFSWNDFIPAYFSGVVQFLVGRA